MMLGMLAWEIDFNWSLTPIVYDCLRLFIKAATSSLVTGDRALATMGGPLRSVNACTTHHQPNRG